MAFGVVLSACRPAVQKGAAPAIDAEAPDPRDGDGGPSADGPGREPADAAADAALDLRAAPLDGMRDVADATADAALDAGRPPGTLIWRQVGGAPPGDGFWPAAMWGGGGELYVGWDKIHHRSAAGTWTSGSIAKSKYVLDEVSIWGSGPHDVYAGSRGSDLGSGGLFHSTGDDQWTPVTLPAPPVYIRAVWGLSADDVYAAGRDTPIFHLQKGVWRTESVTFGTVLAGFWASGPTDVYALGSNGGELWRSSGDGSWRFENPRSTHLPARIWGSGPGDVYILISPYNNTMFQPVILHSTGKGDWAPQLTLTNTDRLYDIWGSGPGDVYVTGTHDAEKGYRPFLYHSTGDGQWTEVPAPPVNAILSIWGSGPDDVYIGAGKDLGPGLYGGVLYNGKPN